MIVPNTLAGYLPAGDPWTGALSSSTKISLGSKDAFLKRLTSRARRNAESVGDFDHEAWVLRTLNGNGAPRLIAHGVDEAGPYLATDWCDFPTLTGRRSASLMAALMHSAFEALDLVHRAEDEFGLCALVHGDISPANVLLAANGSRALLVDFGLALSRHHRPEAHAFRGTLAVVAPEVARGELATPRADIFSLAMSLAHAIEVPLRSTHSDPQLLVSAGESPIDVSPLSSTLPAPLVEVLAACLEFDASKRPDSARTVLSRIALC